MKKILTTKKRVVIAAGAGALVIATGGTAFAYFTAGGSGTGSASVGSATNWKVAGASDTSNSLYPGSGSEDIAFTVTNPSSQSQVLGSVTPSIGADGSGNVLTSRGTSVGGCLAAWFTPTLTNPAAGDIIPHNTTVAGNADVTVNVNVTMTETTTNQDPCQGITPQVVLTVNKGDARTG
jgi:hypothetical protein